MGRFKFIRTTILIIVALATITLFVELPAPADRMLNIQNYLITVSGIIAGIVIAYLSSKIFNLKQDRANRQIEINQLSEKLTNYRRTLYAVMRSHDFWVRYDHIKKFKVKYPSLTFEMLHGGKDELGKEFWRNENELSITTIDLYLAMESIYGESERHELPWIYDRTIEFNYSLKSLSKYYEPSNQIWYYLDGRYQKHTDGLINDTEISRLYQDKVREWLTQIDIKYRNREFDRLVLAEVSTDFHEVYIPKLIDLTTQNTEGLPKQVDKLFTNLVVIFIIGVVFPLFIQSISISRYWNIILTLSAVGIICTSFVYFLFDFYKLMVDEIKPK